MYQALLLFTVLLSVSINFSFAQTPEREMITLSRGYKIQKVVTGDERFIEYRNKVEKVISAPEIVHYGLDLKPMILTDWEYVGQEEKLDKYLSAWVLEYNKHAQPERLKKLFDRGKTEFNLVLAFEDVQSRFTEKADEWISSEEFSLSVDDVSKRVESFKLQRNEGIGYVVIAENFNAPKNLASAYYTFFDIKSREVLWTVRTSMRPSGLGLTKFWSMGLIRTFDDWKADIYNRIRKKGGKYEGLEELKAQSVSDLEPVLDDESSSKGRKSIDMQIAENKAKLKKSVEKQNFKEAAQLQEKIEYLEEVRLEVKNLEEALDKAVQEKNYIKAHEIKQKILKLEGR